jgi:aldose 1-epimerase
VSVLLEVCFVATTDWMIGAMPLKKTQGFFNDPKRPRVVPKYGCLVMEVQDWIDGINNPAWLRDPVQVLGPKGPPYEMEAMYSFSVKPPGKPGMGLV